MELEGGQGGCQALRGGEQRGKEWSFCRKCKITNCSGCTPHAST